MFVFVLVSYALYAYPKPPNTTPVPTKLQHKVFHLNYTQSQVHPLDHWLNDLARMQVFQGLVQ